MGIDANKLAVEYYFGNLQYWKLPRIAADALKQGGDGIALRKLAELADRSAGDLREEDIQANDIDSAFREMGVDAPITKEAARLTLAIESAQKALRGQSNVLSEATHIRIRLCELSDVPAALSQIVNLSKAAKNAPRSQWSRLESDLQKAFVAFLKSQDAEVPE